MTFWQVLLLLICVILLLLAIPVRVVFNYRDSARVRLCYLFFRCILPSERKPREKKPKKEEAEKKGKKPHKKSAIGGILKEKGLGGFLSMLKDIMSLAGRAVRSVLRRSVVTLLRVHVAVAGEDDAAQAAITCGYCCAVIYPVVTFLTGLTTVKKTDVIIRPDYRSKENHVDCTVRAFVFPIVVLWAAAAAFFRYITLIVKRRVHERIKQGGAVK